MKLRALSITSVRQKLFVGSLLTSIAVLLIVGGSLFVYDLHRHRQASAADLAIEAEMLANASAAALQFDDRAVAAQNLALLRTRTTVRSAQIFDALGNPFAFYSRDAGAREQRFPRGIRDGIAVDGDRVQVTRKIVVGAEPVGTIHLQADLQMGERIVSYVLISLAVSIAALLLALPLSARLQAGITGPIIEMSGIARSIVATRDYSTRALKRSDDEVGHLADALNEMLGEIQARTAALEASRDEIAALNADLEQRVGRRTRELEDSNLRLRAADDAKSRFLSMMSHEIRTPMNGVLGMLELLALTHLDMQQRSTLEVVRESGRSLLRIIDDILDFSKIEAGKLEVIPQVASIARIVAGVIGIYSGNASSKSLTLRSEVDPRLSPAVRVDPTRLQQILNNLVSNAIKFTSQGEVQLKAELVERRDEVDVVRFVVTDTGVGIEPEAQARLFQPFSQADSQVGRVFGGTGLGLSIGQRLAALMGGAIEMHSTHGKGTIMTLVLPLPIEDPAFLPNADGLSDSQPGFVALSRRKAPSAEQAEREGTLVLVVDDHPINRLVLMRQVTLLGYASETADDGLEALQKWESGRFVAVITDCNMPQMTGYELARAIRKAEHRETGKRTLIIACTANALRGEAENCFAAGMDDYIAKPVEISRLMAKLDYWIPIPALASTGARPSSIVGSIRSRWPINPSILHELSGGVGAIELEALQQFQACNAADCSALLDAIEIRDLKAVASIAHRIAGASATLGAAALAEACRQVEAAARAGNWEEIMARQDALLREVARINADLRSLLQQSPVAHPHG